jgi:serine/threonine-protein kinase
MVLHGSVRRSGNRLRLAAQLITINDGLQLWSDHFVRELTDVFAVQDEIANAIAARLEITLTGERAATTPSKAPDFDAYELYLRGRLLLKARGRAVLEALALLRESVARDANSAPAIAALGDANPQAGAFGLLPQSDALPRGKGSTLPGT